ncbi:hypothetical protein [Lysobacter sp. CA199]|uniref:hypothetical protein n=1 Tax=Lysobacter sp. CA199 TaxID=3455608 RepID=UPI003F8D40D4
MRTTLWLMGMLLSLPAVAKDTAPVPADLAPTHGYVYLAYPRGAGQAIAIVESSAGGKSIRVDTPAAAAPVTDASAVGQWLPAGHYRIAQWGPTKSPGGSEFDVQTGRVTDLGSVVPVKVGGYQYVVVPVVDPDHAVGVAAAIQPIAAWLKDPAPLAAPLPTVSSAIDLPGQSHDLGLIAELLLQHERKVNKPPSLDALKAEKRPAEFLRLYRQTVQPSQDEPARLADGTLLFPADLGQIRKRSPDGQWSSVGMDTVRQIFAVEAVDGRWLAGSDDGRLSESRDNGATWAELKRLGSQQTVLDIDHADGAWVVATTEKFDDPRAARGSGLLAAPKGTTSMRLRVYVARDPSLADLVVSKEFVLAPKDQIGWLGARGQLVDGAYYIATGNALQRLDVADGRWTAITPGPRISSLRANPDSGVLTAMWSQGAFSKVYISSDRGATWTQIGRPPYVIYDVQMDSADRGWASRWNMNAFSGVWETYTYVPAKKDWDQSGEAPFNCRLLRVAADVPVLCMAPDSSILGLKDGKWGVEYSAR